MAVHATTKALVLGAILTASFEAYADDDIPPCLSDNPPADCPGPEELMEMADELRGYSDALEAYQKEWERKYEWAYYECEDKDGAMTLEISQSPYGGVRTPGQKIKKIGYSEYGPYRYYTYLDDNDEPTGNYLMMQPNGFTGLVMKGTKKAVTGWFCTEAEWPEAQ